ncbi:MAG: sugar phosphate isomerase/epimerase family protein [Planctomycetota bacterium]
MKLSFTTLGCPDWTLEEIAKNAAAMGFDGVELRTREDGNHFSPDAPAAEAARVGKMFRDAGAPVMSVMGYSRFTAEDPAEVAKNQVVLRKLVGVAGAMGAPFIRTFAGNIPKGADRAAMVRQVADAIRPAAREAEAAKVVIGLETHDDWCVGELVLAILRAVDSPAFRLVYDIHNALDAKVEPWGKTYAMVKSHIAYCHLKDGYPGKDGKLHYVPVGAGQLPLADILATFKADGYDGFFSFEWEKKWHPEIPGPEYTFPAFAWKVRAVWDALPVPAARKKGN